MRRLNGYSEKWLEDRLALGLKARGLANFHVSDPTKPGIPDRYVIGAGGAWIEVKQGKTFVELIKGFDRQRVFLNNLKNGGDKARIVALFQPNNYTAPSLYSETWGQWLWREKHLSFDVQRSGSPWEITDLTDLDKAWDTLARALRA